MRKITKKILNSKFLKAIIVFFLITGFLLPLLNFPILTTENTLDSSWFYALTKTKSLSPPLIFGKDIGFTYGPMASLFGPVLPQMEFDNFARLKLIFSFLMLLMVSFLIVKITSKISRWKFLILLGSLFLTTTLNLSMLSDVLWAEVGLLLAFFLLTYESPAPVKIFLLLIFTLFSGFGIFLKFSFGFYLFLFSFILIGIFIIKEKKWLKIYGFSLLIVLFLTIVIVWYTLTGANLWYLFQYFQHGIQISSNYSEIMASEPLEKLSFILPKSLFSLRYLFPVGIIFMILVIGFRSEKIFFIFLLLNSFFLFKIGFTRADYPHLLNFFKGIWFILLCVGLMVEKRRNLNFIFLLLVIFWFVGFKGVELYGFKTKKRESYLINLSFMKNFWNITDIVNWEKNFEKAKVASTKNLLKLEKKYEELFQFLKKESPVDKKILFLPWELMFAEIVPSKLQVLPTLQVYNSPLCPLFKKKDIEMFSNNPPDYILLGLNYLQKRSLVADMSHIFPFIISNYEIVKGFQDYVLLKKKANFYSMHPIETHKNLNILNKLLFVKAKDLIIHPWFNLQKFLFKGPIIVVDISTKKGKREYRISPTQLEKGVFFLLPGVQIEDLFSSKKFAPPENLSVKIKPVFFYKTIDITAKLEINLSIEVTSLLRSIHLASTEKNDNFLNPHLYFFNL